MPMCNLPIDVYVYCTKTGDLGHETNAALNPYFKGKVVAKFTLKKVEKIKYHFGYYDMGDWTESYILENSCLTSNELDNYLGASKEYNEKVPSRVYGYAWHIDDLVVFDQPKELKAFLRICGKIEGVGLKGEEKSFSILTPVKKAPQSWCYIDI